MEHRQAYSVHQKQSIRTQDSGTTIIGAITRGMTHQVSFIRVRCFVYWMLHLICKLRNSLVDPLEYCDVYEGQKSGRFDNSKAVASMAGRTDVEGCCWWGRGVIQTTGVCNYGKLNYYLGARAAQDGRSSKYPDIDFCKTPDKICSDPNYPELKWIAGFFYWMESVQSYDQQGWYYLTALHEFVNGGMEDTNFIDSVSGIVNRGCHDPPCATGEVDGLDQRRENFSNVLKAMGLPSAGSGGRPAVPVPQSSTSSGDAIHTSTQAQSSSGVPSLTNELAQYRDFMEQTVLSYTNLHGTKVPSELYTFEKLLQSLSHATDTGYAEGKKFYTDSGSLKYGFVNLAAFLAQAMTESIQYDACEEFHLDSKNQRFPISNSCGQFGENYQDYKCDATDAVMECPILSGMFIEAADGGKYNDHRPNFYCRSKSQEPFTGAFDERTSEIYSDEPYPNTAGRTDVEDCCFWGR
jgi:predicted chitinase